MTDVDSDDGEQFTDTQRARIAYCTKKGDVSALLSCVNVSTRMGMAGNFADAAMDTPEAIVAHFDEVGHFEAVEGVGPASSAKLEAAVPLIREASDEFTSPREQLVDQLAAIEASDDPEQVPPTEWPGVTDVEVHSTVADLSLDVEGIHDDVVERVSVTMDSCTNKWAVTHTGAGDHHRKVDAVDEAIELAHRACQRLDDGESAFPNDNEAWDDYLEAPGSADGPLAQFVEIEADDDVSTGTDEQHRRAQNNGYLRSSEQGDTVDERGGLAQFGARRSDTASLNQFADRDEEDTDD